MNLFADFVDDVSARGPMLRNILVLAAGLMLAASLVVGLFYVVAGRGAPPSGLNDTERIPGQTYTVGFIEVFQCLRQGPQGCSEYQDAQAFLVAAVPAEGVTYQPLRADDPGTATDDGLKQFTPTAATPNPEWRAFANAVTLDGAVSTSTVNEDQVTVDESDVTRFPVTTSQGEFEGQMTLGSADDGTLAIAKVIYESAGGG